MKTWDIYLKLQGEMAYGTGIGGPSASTPETNQILAEYVKRVSGSVDNVLVIGPGGPSELAALMPHVSGRITALTSHEPEKAAIIAALGNAVDVEIGDMHELPFASGRFSLLYASNVLEHAIAPYAALMQIRRVLREGGIANLVLPSFSGGEGGKGPFHLHCLSEEVWRELLRKTGLVVGDVYIQQGADDPTAYYMHFRCIAAAPPTPHDKILNELQTFHATH